VILRIGFLTTIGVNVGDEFIREGVRAALDRSGVPYIPLYVNKHDRESLTRPCGDELVSVSDKFWDSDVFIQSGAPVYWNIQRGASSSVTSEWYGWMWRDRILKAQANGEPRFLNLGAGSCQPWGDDGGAYLADPKCVRFAREAGSRARLTTVRDPLSAKILSAVGVGYKPMPCPAFLAAVRHRFPTAGGDVIGVNLMPRGGHYQLDPDFDAAVWTLRCWRLVNSLRKLGSLAFIAHDDVERAFMSPFAVAGERVFCAAGWREYLDVYSGCRAVVANRVHGALCAAGFGAPAVILGSDSRASIADYIAIPRFRASHADPEEVVQTVASMLRERETESERLLHLRDSTLEEYVELIAPALADLPQPGERRVWLAFEPRTAVEPEGDCMPAAIAGFGGALAAFSALHDLPPLSDRSEMWVCAWLWLNALGRLDWKGQTVVDLFGQTNPVPWFMASLGAKVILLTEDPSWAPRWERWRDRLRADVSWRIAVPGAWPLEDCSAAAVTAFSLTQLDSATAVEAARVLRPGGLLTLSLRLDPQRTDRDPDGSVTVLRRLEELFAEIPSFRHTGAPDGSAPPVKAPRISRTQWSDRIAAVAVVQKALATEMRQLAAAAVDLDWLGDRTRRRLEDLLAMRNAIEAYHQRNHVYPRSSGGWDGLYSRWGASTPGWIPGLVPEYLSQLPRDPRKTDHPELQYLYTSDGLDYKLISHLPEDIDAVGQAHPDTIDPVREGWAYGFWTDGAARW
jgi:polysaccharide pyruvyl transferase WcaK-like protein